MAARTVRLDGGIRAALWSRRRRLEGADGRLGALSPLRVIDRGYSITVDTATGRVITTAAAVAPGAVLRTRLAQGSLVSEVMPGGVEAVADRERMYDEDDHG